MKRQTCLVTILIILTGCTAIQSGQHALNHQSNDQTFMEERLFTYLPSVDVDSDLKKVTNHFQDLLGINRSCGEPLNIKTISYGFEVPTRFVGDKGHPVEGVWQHRYIAEQCGTSKIFNVLPQI